jgi:hypothetical protein
MEIEFIDHFKTRLVTTLNSSAIPLQITTAHAKSFQSVFSSRSLVTASNSRDSSTAPTKFSLHRLPYNSLQTLAPVVLIITSRHGSRKKYRSLLYSNRCRANRFAKALLSNGCVYALIENLLPSSGYFSLFVRRQRVYTLHYFYGYICQPINPYLRQVHAPNQMNLTKHKS